MRHTPRFLFIMDAYETLNLATETSLLMMQELLGRGARVSWAELKDLVLDQDSLSVKSSRVDAVAPLTLEVEGLVPAGAFDAIVIRTDPPFDETYLHLTYLLDFVPGHVRQFNRADALRSYNEKLLPLSWPGLAPATLVSMDVPALLDFLKRHGDIVLKPLGDCSGRGIVRLKADVPDAETRLQDYVQAGGKRRFVLAQAFLPEIADGDKRIYLVAGKPVGAVNRVPAEGKFLGNIHQGARVEAATVSAAEQAAIDRIAPFLIGEGLLLVGADFIGGKLTELNITSPSAVRQINAVSETPIHPLIVDAMLAALEQPAARCCGLAG